MFWNIFKSKKKEEEQEDELNYNTWISYGISDDDLICVDINIEDYSKESLDNFAKLLAGVSTMSFVNDTIATIKRGFEGRQEEYEYLMDRTSMYAQQEVARILEETKIQYVMKDSDEPCIKPSDIAK
jgi:hypothetical protein